MQRVVKGRDIATISHYVLPRRQAARRHYGVHPFFTRRAWNVVQEYIRNFTTQGDTVLDPFGGSGVTAIEALVLGRRAIHVDISPLANFITEQIAISPVDTIKLNDGFLAVQKKSMRRILELYEKPDAEIAQQEVPYWYPTGVRLPPNADVDFVDQLFTPRCLCALSILLHHIKEVRDRKVRSLLLLAFSATLGKVNRTFVSTKGRAESRGGSTIFSIYRYHVPDNPVELNVWNQFEMRFRKIVAAKEETNQEIGSNYSRDKCRVVLGSATKLTEFIEPQSVDYIFTDPPYGAHISYLDLSTMWNAWLEFEISEEQWKLEVIENGSLKKTKLDYEGLLGESLDQMFRVLKTDSWLSVVFAHKDPSYWDTLVKSAQKSGFEYVNTVAQPLDVVWSMHKKKNPLHVLSGELILNFRKVENPRTIAIMDIGSDVVQVIKNCAELTIVQNHGASTEKVYEQMIPRLLEAGLLGEVKRKISDITPLLKQEFTFSSLDNQWHIKPNTKLGCFIPLHDRIRFYVRDYLVKCEKDGNLATFDNIVFSVMPQLVNGDQPTKQSILEVLEKIAHSSDKIHWSLSPLDAQLPLALESSLSPIPKLAVQEEQMEHNEVIYRLAKLGLAAGLLVHIGKKEQSQSWNGEKFHSLSLRDFPCVKGTTDFTKGKVEQLDCVWLDTSSNVIYVFEVEGTTPITTGIDRMIELLKLAPETGKQKRLVLIVPPHRAKEINTILRDSHYIGHPYYMETKLSYLYYPNLLEVYQDLTGKVPTAQTLIGEMDAARKSPHLDP